MSPAAKWNGGQIAVFNKIFNHESCHWIKFLGGGRVSLHKFSNFLLGLAQPYLGGKRIDAQSLSVREG